MLAVLAFVVTAATWPIFHGAEPPGPRDGATRQRAWDADRARLVICYGTFGFGYIIPATFIPVMAREIVRDPVVFGSAWPVFGLAAAASTFAAARLASVLTNRRLWSLSHLLMGLGVALPVVSAGITGILGAALFVGQILTSKDFGGFGDSGSLVVTDDGEFHPVGIVIGGGSNGTAIASPIGPILKRFGAQVCGD